MEEKHFHVKSFHQMSDQLVSRVKLFYLIYFGQSCDFVAMPIIAETMQCMQEQKMHTRN